MKPAAIKAELARSMDSEYSWSSSAQSWSKIYGEFPGCRILGAPCTIRSVRKNEGWPEAMDALGFSGVFSHVGMAIHVSGKDEGGRNTGPGRIRGLAEYSIDWLGAEKHPSGLGCHKPEPAAIITCDGWHYRPDQYYQLFLWTGCNYIFTLAGVLRWSLEIDRMPLPFTPGNVLGWADKEQGRKSPMLLNEAPHVAALRRLLEAAVGSRNNGLTHILRRRGRWEYEWVAR